MFTFTACSDRFKIIFSYYVRKPILVYGEIVNKRQMELEYQKFFATAERWKTLVESHSAFNDTNSSGEPFRHVALTDDPKVFDEARECIAEWQAFADLCIKSGKNGIASNILEATYLPVPFIVEDRSRATYVSLQSATSAKLISREQILKKYKTIVGILGKSSNGEAFSQAFAPLSQEYQFFMDESPDEQYRIRRDGFTDTVIATPTGNSSTLERYRVGTHGALVFAHLPNTKLPVFNHAGKRRRTTVYDCTKPVPCSLIRDGRLYRVRDLEYGQQTFITKVHFIRSIESRNMKFNKRVASLNITASPDMKDLIERKIEVARAALKKLEDMDMELIDIMIASGDNLSKMKLTHARQQYGKGIEERHGETFNKVQSAAKLRL